MSKIILLITFFCTTNINAQTPERNLKKYWWYHYRLLKDFMAKGDCQGCSIPMEQRHHFSGGGPEGQWSDGPIGLGHYISVLATEYKLLHDNSQLTDTTVQELYYAIKALNRLDESAETYFGGAASLNGFLLRDDVPQGFLANRKSLRDGVTSTRTIGSVSSSFTRNSPPAEMSSDHLWYLLTGMSLITNLFGNDVVQYVVNGQPQDLGDGTYDITREARYITDRIMTHLKNYNWRVYNEGSGAYIPYAAGGDAQVFSYGAAEAACRIDHTSDPSTTFLLPNYTFPMAHTCNDGYHDGITALTAPTFIDAGYPNAFPIALFAEDYKFEELAALCDCWYTQASMFFPDPTYFFEQMLAHPFLPITNPAAFAQLLLSILPVPPINVTTPELAARALFRHNEHLPLLRQVLHGGSNPITPSFYETLLNSAPCNGPYCFQHITPGDCAEFNWSASSRLNYSEERVPQPLPNLANPAHMFDAYAGGSTDGEYNGLDYMLYYNLYHIINPSSAGVTNYMDRVITINFPHTLGGGSIGNPTNPATIDAFNTITASNTISSNGVVTYHAGNEIALLPGFQSLAGADFHAYEAPFHCGADGEYRKPATSTNNNPQSPTDNLVAYNGPTSYKYYPPTSYSEKKNYITERTNNNISQTPNAKTSNGVKQNIAASKSTDITIIPNPNNGEFQISIIYNNKVVGIKELKIMDVLGTVVWETGATTSSIITVNISTYSKGIYFVRSINESGEIMNTKLIKQ